MRQKAICALSLFLLLAPGTGWAELTSVFGGRESQNLAPFTKWMRVLDKRPEYTKKETTACEKHCTLQGWHRFLDSLKSESRSNQIRTINLYMNKHPYITDIANWGISDYWETPLEFIRRHGDCEDYAIAKFFSLRYLGFENKDMRIVILKDHNINAIHSVLAIREAGQFLILDNQVSRVVEAKKVHHYEPIYSVNEDRWWRYQ